eukprot:2263732-Lingulodinium_polyedra.AAC.1
MHPVRSLEVILPLKIRSSHDGPEVIDLAMELVERWESSSAKCRVIVCQMPESQAAMLQGRRHRSQAATPQGRHHHRQVAR